MKITLTISSNGRTQKRELEDGTYVVGREPKCALPFEGAGSEHVSWNHAQISVRDDGAFLKDLGSSNGTYLNDRKLAVETKVLDGDKIRLGWNGPQLTVESVALDELVSQSFTSGPGDDSVSMSSMGEGHAGASPFEKIKGGPPPLNGGAPAVAVKPALPSPGMKREPEPSESPSTTRKLLIRMQKTQRGWRAFGIVAGIALVATLAVSLAIFAWNRSQDRKDAEERDKLAAKEREDTLKKAEEARRQAEEAKIKGTEVYKATLKSTAWIIAKTNVPGQISTGTGSLIDKDRRLVVTNYHVVGDNKRVVVMFPEYTNGEAISDREHYFKIARKVFLKGNGTVVVNDPGHDIAIVQLDSAPADVPALKLVEKSPAPGTRVHTVGNPGAGGALWTYSHGAVRQVAKVTFKARISPTKVNTFSGWTVETQNPINSGDSGGPVVNDDGELVAINMSHRTDARLVTRCVDIREIQNALKTAVSRTKP